jgi:predicted NBD/HSP70 family sugar kinase
MTSAACSNFDPAVCFIGLDVGGTKCAAVLGDGSGGVYDRIEWPSQSERGRKAMVNDLVGGARRLIAKHGTRLQDLSATAPAVAAFARRH